MAHERIDGRVEDESSVESANVGEAALYTVAQREHGERVEAELLERAGALSGDAGAAGRELNHHVTEGGMHLRTAQGRQGDGGHAAGGTMRESTSRVVGDSRLAVHSPGTRDRGARCSQVG